MKLSDVALPDSGKQGRWFDYVDVNGTPRKGVKVKVASSDQDEYRRDLARPAHEFAAKRIATGRVQGAIPSQEAQEESLIQAIAKHILKDWKGIEDEKGGALSCTQQTRVQFLRERLFREAILHLADDLAAFREAELGD